MRSMRFPYTFSLLLLLVGAFTFALANNDGGSLAPSYTEGVAEGVHESQKMARVCIDKGGCDPLDPTPHGVEVTDGEVPTAKAITPSDGKPNPDYDGSSPTVNPQKGVSDPEPIKEIEEDDGVNTP